LSRLIILKYKNASFKYNESTQEYDYIQKLFASDAASSDVENFGCGYKSISISGDGQFIVIGSHLEDVNGDTDAGAAYTYRYNDATGQYDELTKLVEFDAPADRFGFATAMSEDGKWIIVGGAHNSYSAYIFNYNDATQQYEGAQRLGGGKGFGTAAAMSEDGVTLAVVEYYSSYYGTNAGAVKVFTRNADNVYELSQYLEYSGAQSGTSYGSTVDISLDGSTIIVGEYGTKSVHVHRYDDDTQQYHEMARLSSTATDSNEFGFTAAISGDARMILVGAPLDDVDGETNQGSAYLYVYNEVTLEYDQVQRLVGSDSDAGDQYAHRVGISTNAQVILLGAKGANGGGAAYAYSYDANSGTFSS